jgi:hypothetical protein
MLPLIAGFAVSLVGSFVGKAISNWWEASKTQTAKTTTPEASGSFASVLGQETQRFAQAPGGVTDARPAALPPTTSFGAALRSLDEFQAP